MDTTKFRIAAAEASAAEIALGELEETLVCMMGIQSNSLTYRRRSLRHKSSTKFYGEYLYPGRNPRRIRSLKLPHLPLDITVDIISRLPVNSLIRCKSLSKAFNNLISEPPFSQICLTNRSTYSSTLLVDKLQSPTLYLLEFDQRDIYSKRKRKSYTLIHKVAIFNVDRFKGCLTTSLLKRSFSAWGYCKGLFCLLKMESSLFNLFVTNPVLGQFFRLPQPALYYRDRMVYLSYGLGHCQFTNRYKVLRIITKCLGGSECKSYSQIFTIGSDKKWRSLSDVNVRYNIKWGIFAPNPQCHMVALHSALHWVVQPVPSSQNTILDPNWGGGTMCICAFDVTRENVTALPLPPLRAAKPHYDGCLIVLLDKLCVWQFDVRSDFDLWVMDDYDIQGSWTKQFVLKSSTLPADFKRAAMKPPLTVSLQGVIVVSDGYQVVFYDMNKEKCFRVIYHHAYHYPIPFVPAFVSLENLVQG